MKGIITAIVIALLFGIFSGAIGFGLGYFGGWILECVCGETVANGLNMVLGAVTQHEYTPNDIPLFCAIMTTIGSFFKSTSSSKSSD